MLTSLEAVQVSIRYLGNSYETYKLRELAEKAIDLINSFSSEDLQEQDGFDARRSRTVTALRYILSKEVGLYENFKKDEFFEEAKQKLDWEIRQYIFSFKNFHMK